MTTATVIAIAGLPLALVLDSMAQLAGAAPSGVAAASLAVLHFTNL
jgi:hypothetical protein